MHIQIAESADFDSWSLVNNGDGSQKDALPDLPSWVDAGNANTVSILKRANIGVFDAVLLTFAQWAPDVIRLVSHHTITLVLYKLY